MKAAYCLGGGAFRRDIPSDYRKSGLRHACGRKRADRLSPLLHVRAQLGRSSLSDLTEPGVPGRVTYPPHGILHTEPDWSADGRWITYSRLWHGETIHVKHPRQIFK